MFQCGFVAAGRITLFYKHATIEGYSPNYGDYLPLDISGIKLSKWLRQGSAALVALGGFIAILASEKAVISGPAMAATHYEAKSGSLLFFENVSVGYQAPNEKLQFSTSQGFLSSRIQNFTEQDFSLSNAALTQVYFAGARGGLGVREGFYFLGPDRLGRIADYGLVSGGLTSILDLNYGHEAFSWIGLQNHFAGKNICSQLSAGSLLGPINEITSGNPQKERCEAQQHSKTCCNSFVFFVNEIGSAIDVSTNSKRFESGIVFILIIGGGLLLLFLYAGPKRW